MQIGVQYSVLSDCTIKELEKNTTWTLRIEVKQATLAGPLSPGKTINT
jgi:hypothetical protein